jgi:proline dehydrogenase
MGLVRSVLLAASENQWLRQRAPHLRFVSKAVRRFMPGERLEDALAAAAGLRQEGIGAVLTQLGENVTDLVKANDVTRHYNEVLMKTGAGKLDCHISVKLTQLGLDVDPSRCHANLRSLVECAKELGTCVWIDMEQHTYVDATLEIYRRVQSEFTNVGVCLQAYLYRTADDLASLIPLGGGGVRLVKGAYREPASVAYAKRRDVDGNFLTLARLMLSAEARAQGLRAVFGTHDRRIIRDIERLIAGTPAMRQTCEFHLLFGIQRAEQARLARERHRVRVLISYGEQWFPWYMRRLAERPANVLFVVKSMLSN